MVAKVLEMMTRKGLFLLLHLKGMDADNCFYAWHMIFGCMPKLGKSLLQCEAPLISLSYKVESIKS